ncbi:hypothetical protein E2C01_097930 [Portunus trituberculatus]|uniref:Uncharacterized protein n=1 Tax=Portunus trituberculatus TaxID=210409 RepID=A0A5B7JWG4_PORTR|nr:hypothetical protein [Portunus trituberculatus]
MKYVKKWVIFVYFSVLSTKLRIAGKTLYLYKEMKCQKECIPAFYAPNSEKQAKHYIC